MVFVIIVGQKNIDYYHIMYIVMNQYQSITFFVTKMYTTQQQLKTGDIAINYKLIKYKRVLKYKTLTTTILIIEINSI